VQGCNKRQSQLANAAYGLRRRHQSDYHPPPSQRNSKQATQQANHSTNMKQQQGKHEHETRD
jgi:hypothetical protein